MAKRVIPDPLKRRHLIEQDLDESRCLAIADAYEAEGRTIEALQFFVKAGARARLGLVAEAAVAAGDAFLLKQVADILGEDQGQARWQTLADAAQEKGLERYTEMAFRHARSSEE
ncbi:MAG TPA: hypothetical protein EYQ54_06220 [Myxococcales bacterium]|jgi:hypothetical protein|nr:hypothetical protein [Myxococcales bacterium]